MPSSELVGHTDDEVDRIRRELHVDVPLAFRLFWRTIGRSSGRLFDFDDFSVELDDVIDYTTGLHKAPEDFVPIDLSDVEIEETCAFIRASFKRNDLVLFLRNETMVYFVRSDGGLDSPVYALSTEHRTAKVVFDSILSLLSSIVDECREAIEAGYFEEEEMKRVRVREEYLARMLENSPARLLARYKDGELDNEEFDRLLWETVASTRESDSPEALTALARPLADAFWTRLFELQIANGGIAQAAFNFDEEILRFLEAAGGRMGLSTHASLARSIASASRRSPLSRLISSFSLRRFQLGFAGFLDRYIGISKTMRYPRSSCNTSGIR